MGTSKNPIFRISVIAGLHPILDAVFGLLHFVCNNGTALFYFAILPIFSSKSLRGSEDWGERGFRRDNTFSVSSK